VLFTEQAIQQSLSIADRGYILESGRLALSGTSADLLANELLQRVYMGLDGASVIGDDADAAREADGAAVEEREPR
jgi:ABC-type cobalamin transport system ATPase subunit